MKIFILAFKEIKEGLRDLKSVFLMIIIPTLLIMLLSLVFHNDFDVKSNKNHTKVHISREIKNNHSELYSKLLKILSVDGIVLVDDDIKKDDNCIYLESSFDGTLEVVFNSNLRSEGFIITAKLKNYLNIDTSQSDKEYTTNYITLRTGNGKLPSSLDYYGVTMVTLTILFAAVTSAYKIIKERENGTIRKLLSLPISYTEVIIGKLLGGTFLSILQITVTIYISNTFLKVNWGNNILVVLLLLLSEAMMAISIGNYIGVKIRDNKSAWLILLSVIMTFGLIGGAYIPIDFFNNKFFEILSWISPIRYVNESIFKAIHFNNMTLSMMSIILFSLIIVFFTYLTTVRRENEL